MWVDVLVPYVKGEFVNSVHRLGVVESMVFLLCVVLNYAIVHFLEDLNLNKVFSCLQEYVENGIALKAHVPLRLSRQLQPMRQTPI